MFDQTTLNLFSTYPREVGKKRTLVKTPEEFYRKSDLLNGVDEVFTNVNPLDGSINKIFTDFDGPFSFQEAKKVYAYLLKVGIPCIPIASGKKGIHLHILFKTRYGEDNKEKLYKSTKSIILKALGTINGSIDPHVIGDLRRLCRVPNTLRPPENLSYCTLLPPGKAFLNMQFIDFLWYIKGIHEYPFEDYMKNCSSPTFEEVITPEIEKEKITFTPTNFSSSPTNIEHRHLKQLLRPCLYRLLTVEEPRHLVRVIATADLLSMDFSPTEILNIYNQLKWVDFDEDYTLNQILSCKKIYTPRKKMQNLGFCFNCQEKCR